MVKETDNKISTLSQQHSMLEELVNKHTLSTYQQLDAMGFGLKRLDFLRTTVNEIAFENEIPVDKAVTKFLLDVENQYNNKLGFESKIKSLREEVNKLNQELTGLRT